MQPWPQQSGLSAKVPCSGPGRAYMSRLARHCPSSDQHRINTSHPEQLVSASLQGSLSMDWLKDRNTGKDMVSQVFFHMLFPSSGFPYYRVPVKSCQGFSFQGFSIWFSIWFPKQCMAFSRDSAAVELQVLVNHPRVTAIAARWRQAFVGRRHAVHQNLPRQHHVLRTTRRFLGGVWASVPPNFRPY